MHLLLLANASLKLMTILNMRFVSVRGKWVLDTFKKKFQNYFTYINVYLHTFKGLTVKIMRYKVIQNINNIYLPKDPECVSSTMIYHIFVSL